MGMKRGIAASLTLLILFSLVSVSLFLPRVWAQVEGEGFSLQVTPSPLISTIDPGTRTELELKIRNENTVAEKLKMGLRTFTVDKTTGQVNIEQTPPKEVEDFVSFGQDVFTVDAGQWYTQNITIDTPKDAGFSYSFVVLISRSELTPKSEGVSTIEVSVAVFTLLNVNRPDATKQLSLTSFKSAKRVYEYLPAEFELAVENSGNTIVQPKGNVFIGRSANQNIPLAAPEINSAGGYIVPGSTRFLKINWNEGFPSRDSNNKLVWDWSNLKQIRIGRYTAKAVLIYDDGKRDIPIETEVTFWVIPWKIILGFTLICALIIVGMYTTIRRSYILLHPIRQKKKSVIDKEE